jgi:acyl transferase domain-containing protein
LNQVFSEYVDARQVIPMGSVKSQIGHTKNAAGAAGIIKTAMALYHRVLPATINIANPNPDLDFENSPFYLNTETRPWFHPVREYPRRAAISAFGFGGTNFHFILEEYPQSLYHGSRRQTVTQTILLHAADPEGLLVECQTAITELEGEDRAVAFRRLADRTTELTLPSCNARLGFVAETADEAVRMLTTAVTTLTEKGDADAWSLNEGLHYRRSGFDLDGKVVALFSGQGSPYLNMGKELSCSFPPLMDLQTAMDTLFVDDELEPLSSIVFPVPTFDKARKQAQAQRLQLTENAQPAIGAFSAGLFRLFQDAGFKPDFVAGHSFGELTALWAASVLDTDDYLRLAKARGKAMAAPDDPDFDAGGMLAVMGELENLENDIKDFADITIANLNSRNQMVLAGPKKSVARVQKHLKAKKYRTVLLGVSAAFHTPLVDHAQKPFAQAIQSARFNQPQCQIYSNATGKPYPRKPQEIQQRLKEHILNSVRFKDEIENIHADGGFCFIEFGPQNILTRLVDNILQDKRYLAVALNANAKQNSDRQFRDAVIQLRVAGLALGPIDPYEYRPVVTERKKTALTLRLSGMNYVSPKTRESFEAALQDGHQIRPLSMSTIEPPLSNTSQTIPMNKSLIEPHRPADNSPEPTVHPTPDLERINQNLENFQNHQNETIHLHEQFLETQSEYARSFFQIMQQQIQAGPAGLSPDITRSIQQFHQHQGDTLRLHEQYLQTQTEFSRNAFELIRQQMAMLSGTDTPTYTTIRLPAPARPSPPPMAHTRSRHHQSAPVAETPLATPTVPTVPPISKPVLSTPVVAAAPSREKLIDTMLAVVSEKTGYQSQMLELSMDMEADLGIDSIKRVEILNGIQEKLPDLPPVNPEELSELRTLGQIVDHMSDTNQSKTPELSTSEVPTVSTPTTTAIDQTLLSHTLLQVVSEKTGYQPEMLELGMDMEADLGIDSIKRVEILNGIQEKLPHLPEVNPEELSELRTLAQIVEKMGEMTGTTGSDTEPSVSKKKLKN